MSTKKTILIIDDEVDLVEMMKLILLPKGYEVLTAHNGEEGLTVIKKATPHLIVLDMNMPKIGGVAFYNRICTPDGKSRYPVLVLTARNNLERLFHDLKVDGFLSKPFEIDNFLGRVDDIISARYGVVKQEAPQERALKGPKKVLIVENDQAAFDKIVLVFFLAACEQIFSRETADFP